MRSSYFANFTRSWLEGCSKLGRSLHEVGSKFVRSWTEVCTKFVQSWPGLRTKLTGTYVRILYEVAKLNTKWPRTSNEVVPNFEQSSPRTSYEVFQRSLLQHEDIFSVQYMNVIPYSVYSVCAQCMKFSHMETLDHMII